MPEFVAVYPEARHRWRAQVDPNSGRVSLEEKIEPLNASAGTPEEFFLVLEDCEFDLEVSDSGQYYVLSEVLGDVQTLIMG